PLTDTLAPLLSLLLLPHPPSPTLLPYTTLFRSVARPRLECRQHFRQQHGPVFAFGSAAHCRKSVVGAQWSEYNAFGISQHSRRRSEEHTSELQSRFDLVCRLLLEKKNKIRWSGP